MAQDEYAEIDLAALSDDELTEQMHNDLYDGMAAEIVEGTNILLGRGWSPTRLLDDALVAGMKIVGIDFRDGILFVPEVLLAANAMKAGMAILRPLLAALRVWVFFRGTGGIFSTVHDVAANTWGPATLVPGTSDGPADSNMRPTALFDADGGLWLFWARTSAGPKTDIWTVYRNPTTLNWGAPRQVSGSSGNNDFPVVFEKDGALRLFFRSNRSGNFDLYFKTLITKI